jgi:hypothetical protein
MATTHTRKVLRHVWPFPVNNGKPVKPVLTAPLPKQEQLPRHQMPSWDDALL